VSSAEHAGRSLSVQGFTLLELLMTIFIASLVAGLIMASYRGMIIGFGRQARAAQYTQKLSQLKIRLDAAAADIDSVVAEYSGGLEYLSRSTGRRRHLSRRGSRLYLDTRLLADSVSGAAWQVRSAESDSTLDVLFWEVALEPASWIGGAAVIR